MKAYKIVKDDLTDFYTGKVKYEIGSTLIHPDPEHSNAPCGRGFHISIHPWQAVAFNKPGRVLEVSFDEKDILAQDDQKMRVSKLTVIKEVNKHLVYGPNWKKVIKKIERVSDKSKLNTATKPCPNRLLNKAIKRFRPFSKVELKAENRSFKNWAAARAAARVAAWDAAWDAARDASRVAAWDAAWAAARVAAWDAAWDASRVAARDASRDAAWDASWDAARVAAWAAAWDASWDAARVAAWAAARYASRVAAWAVAWDAAWETISDKIKKPNPFETLIDIWLLGYVVYFDKNILIAGYMPV